MSSRKEEKERLRREREERERAAATGARRKRLVGLGVAGVLALAAVGAVLLVVLSGGGNGAEGGGQEPNEANFPAGMVPPVQTADLDAAAKSAGCELIEEKSEGSGHVGTPVPYKSNPPHSGPHSEMPTEDGAYTQGLQAEQLVHSLEHGRILFQFKPDAPDAVKGNLKALFDESPYRVILAPNGTNMPYEVAAAAWTRVLGCKTMNDKAFDALRAFRDRYNGQGPEKVP